MKNLDLKQQPENSIFTQFKKILKAAYMGDIDNYESLGTDVGFTTVILSNSDIFDEIVNKVKKTDFDPDEDSRAVLCFNLGKKYLTLVWESPNDVITSELSKEYKGLFLDEMGEDDNGGFTDNDELLADPENKHLLEALSKVKS